jgi:hypothetical protein
VIRSSAARRVSVVRVILPASFLVPSVSMIDLLKLSIISVAPVDGFFRKMTIIAIASAGYG